MTECLSALGPQGFGSYSVEWTPSGPRFQPTSQQASATLVPGFVDIHFHGAFGVDFMSASRDELLWLADQLALIGYEACLLTTVTAKREAVEHALANIPDHDLYRGFHLEGPFINQSYSGAQPAEDIVQPDSGDWDAVLDDPRLRVVTLAPEVSGGDMLVQRLVRRQLTVSLGHTGATYAEADRAFSLGATHTTHTFNACRPLHHREPGVVGAALTNNEVKCEVIYDGHHVSGPCTDILLRCKGTEGVIGVSDSTAATGLEPGTRLSMWGHDCRVETGKVVLAASGGLAGSAASLRDCFRNFVQDFGWETGIRACCLNGRAAAGMTGEPKTWLVFDKDVNLLEARHLSVPC